MDALTVRGIVLGILKAYQTPSEQSEKEIEAILPLLQYAPLPRVREQAAHASRLWLGLRDRCPMHHRRLIYYRLRHLDNALDQLERMTRPVKKKVR